MNPKIHELKIWPPYYRDVENGVKTFEVRKYDRDFRVGDILILKEYNGEYTGKSVIMRICYALSDPDFVKDGYVILGIQGV